MLQDTCAKILDTLIMSVGFSTDEAEYVHRIHTGHDNHLRLLHYPPMHRDLLQSEGQSRLGAHKDWMSVILLSCDPYRSFSLISRRSSFTILFQDASGGLEFADPITGEFTPAKPADGVLYLNIGDMFMRLTNGWYNPITLWKCLSLDKQEIILPQRTV